MPEVLLGKKNLLHSIVKERFRDYYNAAAAAAGEEKKKRREEKRRGTSW
jgi:hypothetical protein